MLKTYSEELNIKNTILIKQLLEELPEFATEFFRGISSTCGTLTRVKYIYDLKLFFNYLISNEKDFKSIESPANFSLLDLEKITVDHIENFMEYLTYYEKETEHGVIYHQNKASGKSRKLSAIRKMFNYFYKKRKILNNPSELIESPKIREKPIIRLTLDEMSKILDEVANGENLTERQQRYYNYTKKRDLAIITLLLGTGLRVSECVGIDINHIDFDSNAIRITRKGGNEAIIYFGDEVKEALLSYMEERKDKITKEGFDNAFFISLHKKRLTDRAIQNLVKKYSKLVVTLKNISPHKLRSTYGTNLYKETGDIYLVATVLGHKDVNVTKKHYAHLEEERKKSAANIVKLRNN